MDEPTMSRRAKTFALLIWAENACPQTGKVAPLVPGALMGRDSAASASSPRRGIVGHVRLEPLDASQEE